MSNNNNGKPGNTYEFDLNGFRAEVNITKGRRHFDCAEYSLRVDGKSIDTSAQLIPNTWGYEDLEESLRYQSFMREGVFSEG